MRVSSRSRGAGLVLALLCVAGCAGRTCPGGTLPDPQTLRQSAARNDALRTLRAEAAVDQRGPDGRIKGRVMMFMQRPDRVRFDAMSQFGPVAILTSDGERFALSDLKEKRFISGAACPANIARMLGVQLSAGEVLGLLLGELPVELSGAEPTLCQEGVLQTRHVLADGGVFVVEFEAPTQGRAARMTGVRRQGRGGEPIWTVRYEGEIESDGARLPRVVELADHRHDTSLHVRFKQVDVNVRVPEGAFTQQPRPGLAREEVACP